jgi:NADPH:quinone reductase-like Zn-dependent oxidoreductase
MKAWQLFGFGRENLKCVDVPVPKPGPSQVLIRVHAVSLNYRDKLVVEGHYNPHVAFPMTQVADTAGEVVDAGSGVSRISVGDRVLTQYATTWIDGPPKGDEVVHTLGSTIPGGLAEYLLMNESAVVKAPRYLTDEEVSTLPVAALTAWFSLIETGQLERAGAVGAQGGINYLRKPEWAKEVLALTDMRGVDHVLEVAGGKSLEQSLEAVKAGGRISVIGMLDGIESAVSILRLLRKQVTIRGIVTGPRRIFEKMNEKLEEIRIHPVIDKVYSFPDALAAYDHLYRGAFGKVVIRVRE